MAVSPASGAELRMLQSAVYSVGIMPDYRARKKEFVPLALQSYLFGPAKEVEAKSNQGSSRKKIALLLLGSASLLSNVRQVANNFLPHTTCWIETDKPRLVKRPQSYWTSHLARHLEHFLVLDEGQNTFCFFVWTHWSGPRMLYLQWTRQVTSTTEFQK